MKKLSIALAVVLAFALAVPAVAAPSLALAGSLETKFTARHNSLQNESFLSLQAGLQGGSDKTRAVVILSPWAKPDSVYTQHQTGVDILGNPIYGEFRIPSNAAAIVDDRLATPEPGNPVGESFQTGTVFSQDYANMIRSAYLQTTGAFWNGGPEATTTIGSLAINESPFVGDLGNRRGIKVEGLKVGPLGIEAFYAPASGTARILNHDEYNQNPQTKVANADAVEGVKLNAKLAGIDLMANVVRSDVEKPEMVFTGAMMPLENLAVDARVIRDRAEQQAMQIGGSYLVNQDLTVSASYRNADEAIDPMYATRYDADGNGILTTDEWIDSVNGRKFQAFDNKTGARVGADLRLAGVHLNGSYDMATSSTAPDHVAKLAADTTLAGFKLNSSVKYVGSDLNDLTWGAERELQLAGLKVLGSYEGERDSAEVVTHEVKAATTLDMIQPLKGLALDGRVKTYSDGTQREVEANAKYQAPNGMTFGIRHLIDKDHVNGDTSFTSGLKVTF